MIKIVDLADQVWRDLNTPPDTQIPYISTWFRTNVGKLNDNIATDYVIDRATQEIISRTWYLNICNQPPPICNTPPSCGAHYQCFREEEASIFKELFKVSYYEGQINKMLYAGQFNLVTSVSEGDSKVTRQTLNDLAKTTLAFKKDAHDRLVYLCHLYKYNKSAAVQVTGDDFVTPVTPWSYWPDYGPGFYY